MKSSGALHQATCWIVLCVKTLKRKKIQTYVVAITSAEKNMPISGNRANSTTNMHVATYNMNATQGIVMSRMLHDKNKHVV